MSKRTEIIRLSYKVFDEKLADLFKRGVDQYGNRPNPPCKKGCFACCNEPVYVERREAELVVEAIRAMLPEEQARITILVRDAVAKLKAATDVLKADQPHVLDYRALKITCPLLKDGACSIYPDRPFGCRAHVALKPATFCEDDAKRLKQQYMVIPDPINGLLASIMALDNGVLEMEHLILFLSEILLGEPIESGSRQMVVPPSGPKSQEIFR
jgi:Fe-S-cluster containining protein